MPEYIERDALVSWIEKQRRLSKLLTIMAIQETPAADVVAVVRCRECIYRDSAGAAPFMYFYCRNTRGLSDSIKDEDFCPYGERRGDT